MRARMIKMIKLSLVFLSALLARAAATPIDTATDTIDDTLITLANPPLTNASIPVRSLGTLALSAPGFAAVIPQEGSNTLFVSSFHATGSDYVYRINNVASATKPAGLAGLTATKIAGSVTWPNDVVAAPKSIFGTDGVVVGGGFLVPGKGNGGLYFSPSASGSSGSWVTLAAKSGWFYHRAVFADMDGDGVLDMVSCRANQPLFGSASTMLVWLKPKDATKPTGTWVETEIGAGCDALFTVADLDNSGIPEIIAASYFTKQFNLFYSNAKTGFQNKADIKKVLLDGTIGAAFDVQFVDVNGDGKKDLLVTNHQGGSDKPSGSVYAYEIPAPASMADPTAYQRHLLATGFPVTQGGLNQASPGSPVAFYPNAANKSGAPHIAVAGDAAQIAYVLIPDPKTPWTYTTTMLHNCGCTVGKLEVADVDGDGFAEVFVPCYDNGVLAAYSFKA
ncbi:hypothetical protein H0H81_000435 [Sphagnurus paluster]|uniref:VCBS repeat-containing protein n=1 Tax=Sphagnurus paluster TaxID=117069 RepID=A0A9P7GRV1_9AGAR|nr:hypothetical protein H0H81_000435 [Sphagnurus paluster]